MRTLQPRVVKELAGAVFHCNRNKGLRRCFELYRLVQNAKICFFVPPWLECDGSTNEAAEHDYQQLQYVSRKERMADLRRPPQWCSVNEPVEISIDIRNPFRVPLVLKN